MKRILTLLFVVHASACLAADPVVIVTSATSVTVDGANYGKPADAIANNPKLASVIQLALEQWSINLIAAKDAEVKALAAELVQVKATQQQTVEQTKAVLTAIAAAKAEEEKTGRGPRWETLVKGEQMITPIVTEATKDELTKQREALEADIAAKQAELAKLKPN